MAFSGERSRSAPRRGGRRPGKHYVLMLEDRVSTLEQQLLEIQRMLFMDLSAYTPCKIIDGDLTTLYDRNIRSFVYDEGFSVNHDSWDRCVEYLSAGGCFDPRTMVQERPDAKEWVTSTTSSVQGRANDHEWGNHYPNTVVQDSPNADEWVTSKSSVVQG